MSDDKAQLEYERRIAQADLEYEQRIQRVDAVYATACAAADEVFFRSARVLFLLFLFALALINLVF